MSSGSIVVIISLALGTIGILVGRGLITFSWKENITEEHRKKELKKIFRSGILLILLGLGRLLAMFFELS